MVCSSLPPNLFLPLLRFFADLWDELIGRADNDVHSEEEADVFWEAEFSHSLCPECVTRLYPDIASRVD